MTKNFLVLILILIPIGIFGQGEGNSERDSLRNNALNVYMEADSYIKEEIPFINYVRDKSDADLILIYTTQRTGSGGKEHIYYIEGQNRFAGISDTLKIQTKPDDTADAIRSSKVRILKMGLMKYIIDTPLAGYFDIKFNMPISSKVTTDNWNNWVFNVGLSGGLKSNESSKSYNFGTYMNSSRVTEEWRLSFNAYANYSQNDINYQGYTASITERSNGVNSDIVKSLTDHWSAGISGDLFSSIFSNFDFGLKLEPVIEYNFYPYTESTRRQFRIIYGVGVHYNNYIDTTQFFKVEELLYSHKVKASYNIIQKWGTIGISTKWSNYLHNFSINNFNMGALVSLRVVKGLSVTIYGSYSFIHDQISLRKGNVSAEDIYLNRQELSTTFYFQSGFGINYTFGSMYNNIVNPRLDSLFERGK